MLNQFRYGSTYTVINSRVNPNLRSMIDAGRSQQLLRSNGCLFPPPTEPKPKQPMRGIHEANRVWSVRTRDPQGEKSRTSWSAKIRGNGKEKKVICRSRYASASPAVRWLHRTAVIPRREHSRTPHLPFKSALPLSRSLTQPVDSRKQLFWFFIVVLSIL